MKEIEIKAYCKDIQVVKNTLELVGATYIKTENESDTYYNHPARDFRQTDEALRIRTVGNHAVLTYKGPKISTTSKARTEKESPVEKKAMEEILDLTGFKASGKVEKKRDYYNYNGITICVDQVHGLGVFVELEKMGDDINSVESELYTLAGRLKLTEFERRSYLELLLNV